MRQFYPKGNPEEDTQRLSRWLTQELAELGANVQVDMEAASHEDASERWGLGKTLLNVLAGREQLESVCTYQATVTGAPRPLMVWVRTTEKGVVTGVIFRTTFTKPIPNEFSFFKREGKIAGSKYGFEGENTERLNANDGLKKLLRDSLRLQYKWKTPIYFIGEASYILSPENGQTAVWAYTTLRPASELLHVFTLARSRLKFGLEEFFGAVRALEECL